MAIKKIDATGDEHKDMNILWYKMREIIEASNAQETQIANLAEKLEKLEKHVHKIWNKYTLQPESPNSPDPLGTACSPSAMEQEMPPPDEYDIPDAENYTHYPKKPEGSWICQECKKDWGNPSSQFPAWLSVDKNRMWGCPTRVDCKDTGGCGAKGTVKWIPDAPESEKTVTLPVENYRKKLQEISRLKAENGLLRNDLRRLSGALKGNEQLRAENERLSADFNDVLDQRYTAEAELKRYKEITLECDYDTGLINSYGGGDITWWEDYIRAEIGRCNEYWRDILNALSDKESKGEKTGENNH